MSELSAWKVVWIVLAVVGAIAILGGLGMLAMHRCMTGSWAAANRLAARSAGLGRAVPQQLTAYLVPGRLKANLR